MRKPTSLKQVDLSFETRRNIRVYRPNNFVHRVRHLTKKVLSKIQQIKDKKIQVKKFKLKYYLKRRILKFERITQNRLCGVYWEKKLRSKGGGEIYLLAYEWVPTKQDMQHWKNFNRNRIKLGYTQEEMEYHRIMKEWEAGRKKNKIS